MKIPNPGSDEALKQGCLCAVLDNAYGRGYMGTDGVFVIAESCPLHWTKEWRTQEQTTPTNAKERG